MKKLLLLCIILASCTTGERKTETTSTIEESEAYEEGEAIPFSIKDDIRKSTITINGRRIKLADVLTRLYTPEYYYNEKIDRDSDDEPKYIITETSLIEGSFFTNEETCEPRSLLLCLRGDFVEAEYYDLFFLMEDADGDIAVADKDSFDGSQGQASTEVNVEKIGLPVKKECHAIKISSLTEGGDINLHRHAWVEFYIADGISFHSVLKLDLEETNIQDYEATQDENQDSSSEIREWSVLKTSHQGLFDISVKYVQKINGKVTAQSQEVYEFDGTVYQLKSL